MAARSWIRRLFGRKTRPTVVRPRVRHRVRLSLEGLEDRTLLSTTLGVTFDDGSGPLAELAVQREQDYPMCLDINARLLARRGQYAAAESLLSIGVRLSAALR